MRIRMFKNHIEWTETVASGNGLPSPSPFKNHIEWTETYIASSYCLRRVYV